MVSFLKTELFKALDAMQVGAHKEYRRHLIEQALNLYEQGIYAVAFLCCMRN